MAARTDTAPIIPARLGSSRLPGKPQLRGLPMIEHVYKRAELSDIVEATFVATPDEEVRDAMMSFGGKAILTGEHTSRHGPGRRGSTGVRRPCHRHLPHS